MTIDNLHKELDDRLMLIGSQNEKISQLDSLNKNGGGKKLTKECLPGMEVEIAQELDEARRETDRLLRIIRALEKGPSAGGDTARDVSDGSGVDSSRRFSSESLRIKELEEALQESLGITSERDKQIAEQKRIIDQLSAQVTSLAMD